MSVPIVLRYKVVLYKEGPGNLEAVQHHYPARERYCKYETVGEKY
jgi:hypothetical protein